jgi:hypothetical protein
MRVRRRDKDVACMPVVTVDARGRQAPEKDFFIYIYVVFTSPEQGKRSTYHY